MTTTSSSSTVLVPAGQVFSEPERRALAGFLAGYSGLTRDAYALDLRQFALAWPAPISRLHTTGFSAILYDHQIPSKRKRRYQ